MLKEIIGFLIGFFIVPVIAIVLGFLIALKGDSLLIFIIAPMTLKIVFAYFLYKSFRWVAYGLIASLIIEIGNFFGFTFF
jgi:hypothetical protein